MESITIEKASKKICPFIQNSAVLVASANPLTPEDFQDGVNENKVANILCKTDNCMAWQDSYDYFNCGNDRIPNGSGYCKLLEKERE